MWKIEEREKEMTAPITLTPLDEQTLNELRRRYDGTMLCRQDQPLSRSRPYLPWLQPVLAQQTRFWATGRRLSPIKHVLNEVYT
jgi:hypothetical protein